jgi:hypothetical protein
MMIKEIYRSIRFQYRRLAVKQVFTKIYENRLWQGSESVSGNGSGDAATENVRSMLPGLVSNVNAQSLLDAPCGDFNWMKDIHLPIERYYGVDIVDDLIAENQRRFGNQSRSFIKLDLIRDRLPETEFILCRHLFIHLPFRDCFRTLSNFRRSGARHLLITNQVNVAENTEILFTGSFRPLNLLLPPFNFPEPIMTIPDDHQDTNLSLFDLTVLDGCD